ncbi:sodium:proton antiporter [Rubrobacter marinus]|uniref:Sodium:proton antiporter n=1 Tax=Rubrobacter marinus TaxID=2653852 RepID=A0A6G8PW10_9ACTN|nr:cation:proton antiporter [Rubrobacter marinus]QIN78390.1 sodium:proton antiporter [Rubrobacter marinus]
MSELNVGLVTVGALVLLLGLLSNSIHRAPISTPILALLAGVLVGPAAFGLLDPARWGDQQTILEEATRLTLAISLMGVALRLPGRFSLRNWRTLAVLLGFVMPFMWLASGLLVYLLLGLPFLAALLVGAVITPTDPVVSSTIVTGGLAEKNLPARLRHTLSAESGFNDGLAYPFVLLPILLLARPPGEALSHWLTHTLVWEVVAAMIFGGLVGYGAGELVEWAEARETIGESSFLVYTIALSFVVLGAAKLIGTDGILAVFLAGLGFDRAVKGDREQQRQVQEAGTRFFILPIFALLGTSIPWRGWLELGWSGVVLVLAVLLLRRLPAVLATRPLMSGVRGRGETLFLGWFGPVGVAALYYANLALQETGVEEAWTVGSLVICASVLAHGVSATPLTRLYGRRRAPDRDDGKGCR